MINALKIIRIIAIIPFALWLLFIIYCGLFERTGFKGCELTAYESIVFAILGGIIEFGWILLGCAIVIILTSILIGLL